MLDNRRNNQFNDDNNSRKRILSLLHYAESADCLLCKKGSVLCKPKVLFNTIQK